MNKYKKLSLITSIILSTACFSESVKMEQYLKNNNSADGSNIEYADNYKDSATKEQASGFYNYSETIYSRIKNFRNSTDKDLLVDAKPVTVFDVQKYKEAENNKNKEQQASLEKDTSTPTSIFTQGYCRFKSDIEISRMSEYSYLDCDFNELGKGTLAVLLVPDFFAQAVVAQPLYISITDKFGRETRLKATNGAVLNANRTSINLANVMNDHMLEKILASTAYKGGQTATTQAQAYLEAKKDARTKETINYVSTGDGTVEAVKTKNTEEPLKNDYITGAVVELISNSIQILGKSVLSSVKYTFKVNKDAVAYADLVITPDTSDIGLAKKTNLINKNGVNQIDEKGDYQFIPNSDGMDLLDESENEGKKRTQNTTTNAGIKR